MSPCVSVTDGCDEIVLNRLWFPLLALASSLLCGLSLETYKLTLPVRAVWSAEVCRGSFLWTDSQLWQVFFFSPSVVWGIIDAILGSSGTLSPFLFVEAARMLLHKGVSIDHNLLIYCMGFVEISAGVCCIYVHKQQSRLFNVSNVILA